MPENTSTWQVMVFPGTISVASCSNFVPSPCIGKETRILLVACRLAPFQVQLASTSWPGSPTASLDFLRPVWGRVGQETSSTSAAVTQGCTLL